jgi:hypothetical protein
MTGGSNMSRSRSTVSLKVVACAVVLACAAAGTGVALSSASSKDSLSGPGSNPTATTAPIIGTPERVLEGSASALKWNEPRVTVEALDSAADCQVSSRDDQRLELLNRTASSEQLVPGGAVLEPDHPLFVGCFEHPGVFVYSLYDHTGVKLTVDVVGTGIASPAKVSGTLKVIHGTVAELREQGGTIELNGLPTLEMIAFAKNGSFDFQVPAGRYELLVWASSKGGDACGSTPISVRSGQHLSTVLTCDE